MRGQAQTIAAVETILPTLRDFRICSAPWTSRRDELGDLVTGKGSISFAYGRRLPVTLVKKVVKTRLAEVAGKP